MGNVRRLHADPQSPVHGDLGGYSYTAFGKTIAVSDPGGVRPPLDIANQPFQWQGKRLLALGLYDSRARVWSTDLGAFLQPDEYVYLSRAGTLWSWPGQNPFRWRDPSGRDADAGAAEAAVAAAEAAGGLAAGTLLAGAAAVGIVGYAAYDIYNQIEDFKHPIISHADPGKPDAAGKVPCPDAGGRGAQRPPSSSSNTTAEAPDPRNPRHHIFPQQFRPQFEGAGIDIDEYTVEMTQAEHQALHSNGWNDEWSDFFDEHPYASPEQIRNFASDLLNEAGLANRPIVPYY